jgi:hypothetical protein
MKLGWVAVGIPTTTTLMLSRQLLGGADALETPPSTISQTPTCGSRPVYINSTISSAA